MTKKLYILIGTRPNFIKITQFKRVAENHFPNFEIKLIHTGQHFDANMADVFFTQFGITPDYFLNVGGLTPNTQVGQIILKLEEQFKEIGKPDYFMVPGDVNSTLAGAIVANKLGISLIHLESGLRSFDKKMPEEHNRIVADNLANICLVTEPSGIENLKNEQIQGKAVLVGNTMIDTLVYFEPQIDQSTILSDVGVDRDKYVLCTFHRPSNVDDKSDLQKVTHLMIELCKLNGVVLPLHPRTRKMLLEFGMWDELNEIENLYITEPLGYFEFQKLIKHSICVITDSGGIQEETTFRQVPCLTVRENTERPVTITQGTNTLVKFTNEEILPLVHQVLDGTYKKGTIPPFWDGNTTKRILELL